MQKYFVQFFEGYPLKTFFQILKFIEVFFQFFQNHSFQAISKTWTYIYACKKACIKSIKPLIDMGGGALTDAKNAIIFWRAPLVFCRRNITARRVEQHQPRIVPLLTVHTEFHERGLPSFFLHRKCLVAFLFQLHVFIIYNCCWYYKITKKRRKKRNQH